MKILWIVRGVDGTVLKECTPKRKLIERQRCRRSLSYFLIWEQRSLESNCFAIYFIIFFIYRIREPKSWKGAFVNWQEALDAGGWGLVSLTTTTKEKNKQVYLEGWPLFQQADGSNIPRTKWSFILKVTLPYIYMITRLACTLVPRLPRLPYIAVLINLNEKCQENIVMLWLKF